MLVMGIFTYNYFIKVLEDEIINSNIDTMIKVKNSVDIQLNTLKKIPVRLLMNEEFRPFYLKNSPINAMEIQKTLNDYTITNDFIHEIILYIKDYNYMHSSNSSYTLSTFTNTIYNYVNWNSEEFYHDINNIMNPVLRPAEDVIVNRHSKSRFITYMYPLPPISRNPYATLIFLIKEDSLKRMTGNILKNDTGKTIILDNTGNIVTYSHDYDYLKSSQFENIVNDIDGYGSLISTINGIEYFISYAKSAESGWTYITMIPSPEVLKKVSDIKTRIIYGTFLIILTGGIIIYLFMYLNYNPLKRLSVYAKNSWGDIPERANEIEAAQIAIGYLARTSENLNKKISSNHQAIKEYLLSNLLKGTVKNIQEFNKKGEDIKLSFTKPIFRVVIFTLDLPNDNYNVIKDNIIIVKENIIDEIENRFPDEIQGYGKDTVESEKIIFVLATEDISDSMLEVQLLFLQQLIKQKWVIKSTIGVGNKYSSINDIGKSYIQASSAMDYKLIKGENNVIFFNEIAQISTINNYPKEHLEKLELSILQMEPQIISNTIIEIIYLIKENNTPLFMAKCLCFDIINTVIKTTQQLNMKSNMAKKEYPDVLSLTEFKTVDQLADLVKKICFDMCEYIKNNKDHNKSALTERIYSYINDNCNDYNFSVQGMADHFGMSSPNLSHYFKCQTGQTISDHVNHLKIETAKELLKTSDCKLKDVVEKVGYSDVSSFIKKFKQLSGTTPGEYRKLHSN